MKLKPKFVFRIGIIASVLLSCLCRGAAQTNDVVAIIGPTEQLNLAFPSQTLYLKQDSEWRLAQK